MVQLRKWMAIASIAWVPVVFPGCGSGEQRIPTYKATGQLLAADGTALPDARVVLHPADATSKAPKPRGTTDADGRFALTTYDTGDGAPEGDFIVTVEQWLRDNPDEPPKNKVPGPWSAQETSKIRVSITKSNNELAPIRLQ
jgi:hypothetical protein